MNDRPREMVRTALRRFHAVLLAAGVAEALTFAALPAVAILSASAAADRLFSLSLLPSFLAPSAILFSVLFLILLVRRISSATACALCVDRTFALEERLSTAVDLLRRGESNPLAELQLRDSVGAAARVGNSALFRRMAGRFAAGASTVAALALLALLLVALPSRATTNVEALSALLDRLEQEGAISIKAVLPQASDRGKLSPAAQMIVATIESMPINQTHDAEKRIEQWLSHLEAIERAAAEGKLTPADIELLRTLSGRLSSAVAAMTEELQRRGTGAPIRPLSPVTQERVERLAALLETAATGQRHPSMDRPEAVASTRFPEAFGALTLTIREAVTRGIEQHLWLSKYDESIRRYYESFP